MKIHTATAAATRRCKFCPTVLNRYNRADTCYACEGKASGPRAQAFDERSDFVEFDGVPAESGPDGAPGKGPPFGPDTIGREFEDAVGVAAEVTRRMGRRITRHDVEAILEYQPIYDSYDVEEVINALGGLRQSTRPKGNQLARTTGLIEMARARLVPPDSLKDPWHEVNVALDSFLEVLMPGITRVVPGTEDWGVIRSIDPADAEEGPSNRTITLSPEERQCAIDLMDARFVVLSALDSTTNSTEGWHSVCDGLAARFPAWIEQPAPPGGVADVNDAFLQLCRAQRDKVKAHFEYLKYWKESGRIARRLVNRGRRGNRLIRQLYIEELIFNCLWQGTPITEQDLNLHREKLKYRAWERAKRAIYKAAETMAPPRQLKPLLRAAHKLLGGSSSRFDRDCESFVSLGQRRLSPSEREQLRTAEYEPVHFMWGNGRPMTASDLKTFLGDDYRLI